MMEFCAKPMPIVGSQGIALPKLKSIGISGNNFRDIAMDRRQKFGFGMFPVGIWLANRKLFHRFRQYSLAGCQKADTGTAASRLLPFIEHCII